MNMAVRCAECECASEECGLSGQYDEGSRSCPNCKADSCCCISLHLTDKKNNCCDDTSCKNIELASSARSTSPVFPTKKAQRGIGLWRFLHYAKGLYAAALGIEILCIGAAEIGENTGLYLFGFNLWGIVIAYALGYALAGFTTFVTILGRHDYNQQREKGTAVRHGQDSCCSVLEQDSTLGFVSNLKTTFTKFAIGFKRLFSIRKQQGLRTILKSSLFILVTAESVCILTAETVDLIFYQYSILLSVPLALLAGAFTVVAPAAYRSAKRSA
jgi:hypothetical protein